MRAFFLCYKKNGIRYLLPYFFCEIMKTDSILNLWRSQKKFCIKQYFIIKTIKKTFNPYSDGGWFYSDCMRHLLLKNNSIKSRFFVNNMVRVDNLVKTLAIYTWRYSHSICKIDNSRIWLNGRQKWNVMEIDRLRVAV